MSNAVITKMVRFANGKSQMWPYYTTGRYIDYITRQGACFNNPKVDESGLFNVNEDRFYTYNELQDLKDTMKQLNSKQNVWDFVISFDNTFEKQNLIAHPELINDLIKEPLRTLFEKNHMQMDDYEIFFALHENTDNKHIHLGFFEKHELGINTKTKEPYFKFKGLLADDNITQFKELDQNILKQTDSEFYQLMKDARAKLLEQTNLALNNKMTNEYGELVSYFIKNEIHTFMFNKLDETTQNKVLGFENQLIQLNSDLKASYQAYAQVLTDFAEMKRNRNEQYGMSYKNKELDHWLEQEKDGMDVRVCNSILKEVKTDVFNDDSGFADIENNAENALLKDIASDIRNNETTKIKKAMHDVKITNGSISNNHNNYLLNVKAESNSRQYSKNLNQVMKLLKEAFDGMTKQALEAYQNMQKEITKEKEISEDY